MTAALDLPPPAPAPPPGAFVERPELYGTVVFLGAGPAPGGPRAAAVIRDRKSGRLEKAEADESGLRGLAARLADLGRNAVGVAFGADALRQVFEADTGSPFPIPCLDLRELAAVCLPDRPVQTLNDLCGALAIPPAPAAGGAPAECRAVEAAWEKIEERILGLPPPVVSAIRRLLSPLGRHPCRGLFRRAAALLRDARGGEPAERMSRLFPDIEPPAPRRRPAGDAPREAIDPAAVSATLGPDGEFGLRLGGYEHREGQQRMAGAVAEALNNASHLMVEAGTGIGKSLAYLVPAVLWAARNGTPVVVSTNTKNLQAQLLDKDIPLVRRALGVEFQAALIKGRRNYLCLRRFLHVLREHERDLEPAERLPMAAAVAWAGATRTGDLSELAFGELPAWRGLLARLSSDSEECRGPACTHRKPCFLRAARARAQAADVIVANHALVFAELGTPGSVLPPYAHLVFDEAHNLEEAATRFASVEVSRPRLAVALNRLWRPGRRGEGTGLVPSVLRQAEAGAFTADAERRSAARRRGRDAIDAVEAVEPAMDAFFRAIERLLPRRGGPEAVRLRTEREAGPPWDEIEAARSAFAAAVANAERAVQTLAQTLREMDPEGLPLQQDAVHELDAAALTLKTIAGDIGFVLDARKEGFVFWVERTGSRPGAAAAWAAPVDVGARLAEQLYAAKDTLVFSSATLSVRGSFDFMKGRIGLDRLPAERLTEMNAGTPFDYARQCTVLVPMFLPEPDEAGREYTEELGVLLAEVFRRTRGRAMTLFTSYDMLRRTGAVLERELRTDAIRVLAQGATGSREHITRVFREGPGSVLLGTHSFWEGVDIVGDALSCLVVARLPFAVFTDPVFEARCEKLQAEGRDAFTSYSLPNAVIRFRQGFGRLIRSRTDRGVVIVADRRLVARRYGAWFRNSLPAPTLPVHDRERFLDAVESFLADGA